MLTVFHLDPEAEPWNRFRAEVEQLGALRHPNIIEALEVGTAFDGTPYLVTELVPGEDLATRLRGSGALTLSEALGLARQVGAALHAAHGLGVLHRDLRPGSLFLLAPDGDTAASFDRIKILGFGVGRLLMSTVSGMALVGAPEYMAPEQILGHDLDVGPRADQYALAVVLYQALSTARPFQGTSVGGTLLQVVRGQLEPLRALRPDLPGHIDAAIRRAMSRDPDERFPDILSFLQALQEGVPLPLGVAELTEPWLSPPPTIEEAQAAAEFLGELGAVPAAPLSMGVSAALVLARRARKEAGQEAESGPQAVPQAVPMEVEGATVPNTAPPAMAPAATPELVAEAEKTQDYSGPMEVVGADVVEELDEDGRPLNKAGETTVAQKQSGPRPALLPSIIVDLPTRPIGEGDRLPAHVAAPTDPTRLSPSAVKTTRELEAEPVPPALEQLAKRLGVGPRLLEKLLWACGGAAGGALLMRLLSG